MYVALYAGIFPEIIVLVRLSINLKSTLDFFLLAISSSTYSFRLLKFRDSVHEHVHKLGQVSLQFL